MENKSFKVYVVWQAIPGCLANNSCICRTLAEAYDNAKWMKDSWLDAFWENGGRAQGNIRKDKRYFLFIDGDWQETIHIDEDYLTAKEIAESYYYEGADPYDMIGWSNEIFIEYRKLEAEEK